MKTSGKMEKTFEKKLQKFNIMVDGELVTISISGRKFNTINVLKAISEDVKK